MKILRTGALLILLSVLLVVVLVGLNDAIRL